MPASATTAPAMSPTITPGAGFATGYVGRIGNSAVPGNVEIELTFQVDDPTMFIVRGESALQAARLRYVNPQNIRARPGWQDGIVHESDNLFLNRYGSVRSVATPQFTESDGIVLYLPGSRDTADSRLFGVEVQGEFHDVMNGLIRLVDGYNADNTRRMGLAAAATVSDGFVEIDNTDSAEVRVYSGEAWVRQFNDHMSHRLPEGARCLVSGCGSTSPHNITMCLGCVTYGHSDAWRTVGDYHVCDTCFENSFTCPWCEERALESERVSLSIGGHRTVCSVCYENDGRQCSRCDERGAEDDMIWRDGPERYYCTGCDPGEDAEDEDDDEMPEESPPIASDLHRRARQPSPRMESTPAPRGAYAADVYVLDDDKGEFVTAHTVGIEFEVAGSGNLGREFKHKWVIQRDGSVSPGGYEFTTPPMQGKKIREVIEDGVGLIKAAGFYGNHTCGAHTHIGGIKETDLWKIVNTWVVLEDIIYAMLPQGRRTGSYSKPMAGVKVTNLMKEEADVAKWYYGITNRQDISEHAQSKNCIDRYFGMNLHSYWYRGTIEFRCFAGTVDEDKIIGWVKFLQSLIDYAEARYKTEDIWKTLKDEREPAVKAAEALTLLGFRDDVKAWALERIAQMNGGKADKESATTKEVWR